MAYRKISENELAAWMKANPGRKIRINGVEHVAPERELSGIEKFGLGISKPLRAIPGSVYGAITGREKGNPFLTDEEEKSFSDNPMMFGVKNAAGLASFGIPGGSAVKGLGGIARAAGKGALAGGLGGFGYSEEGKELEGILKGGALGGVLGGALQGVSNLASKGGKDINKLRKEALKSAGVTDDTTQVGKGLGVTRGNYVDDIELLQRGKKTDAAKEYLIALRDQGLVDPGQVNMSLKFDYGVEPGQVVKPLPKVGDQELRAYGIKNDAYNKIRGGSEKAKKGVAVLKSEADGMGVSLADRYAKERALKPVMETLSNRVDELSVGMTPQAKSHVLASIDDTIKTIPKYQQNMAYERINNILKTYGDELTGPELRSLYQEIADAGKVYSTSLSAKSNTSEIYRSARDAVRNYFKGDAGREISKIDDLFEIAPFIKRQAGIEWGPNLFGMQFRPVLGTRIVDRLGGAITGAPKALSLPKGLPSGLGSAAQVGQRAIPGVVGMGAQSPQPEPMQQDLQGFSGQTQQPQYTFQDAIMEAYSMFPNATESTILSTAKYLMEQNGGDQDVDTGTIANVQQALQMIDEFGGSAAGKISTITGKVGEFFGGASEGTRYRSLISDIRTKLIKQIAGTAQTPAEMKNLIDRLPEPTDEPAVARVKLEVLLNSLQGGFGAPSESQPINQDYDSWQY